MTPSPEKIKSLSIVIPVYNEQNTIAEVIERVREVRLGDLHKEIIVSNDGSTDATARVIGEVQAKYPGVVQVHTSAVNQGKGAAVRLGMALARGDVIIIQDADLELNPDEYVRILEPLTAGRADIVYGSRFMHGGTRVSARTRWGNRLLTALTNLLFGCHLTDMETAYKAFRRRVVQGLVLRARRFDFEPEITAKILMAGYRIHEVPISYNPRTAQEGKKIKWRDGYHAVYTLLRCRFFDRASLALDLRPE